MHGISLCEICSKEFKWRKRNCDKPARFCCFECKIQGKFRTRKKIEELTEVEDFERIKKHYEKYVIKQDGCWDWKGIIEWTGYAKLGIRPPIKAHRASWLIHKGKIPKGLLILHTCDNRKCTNPNHLWLGTHSDNTQDMIKKGRINRPKGSELKASKINEEDAKNIKILLKNGLTCSEIGRQYKVSRKIIFRIKNGETWKHIK